MQMELSEAFTDATVRIETGCRMDDDAFWDFCVANPDLRIEREPNGDIVNPRPRCRSGSTTARNSRG